MSKIKLGQKPEAFKPFPVKFTMPDGSEGVIKTTFAYKTRSEYGEVLNRLYAESGEERAPGDKVDFVALIVKSREKVNAELLAALKGWDLDFDINAKSLDQLSDEIPAATAALMSAFGAACTEGRLGN